MMFNLKVAGVPMSSGVSEQMMNFLKEMAILKELDNDFATGAKTPEAVKAHEDRQRRREEIGVQMRKLAEEKKTGSSGTAEAGLMGEPLGV
jgi:hypothetical protein